MIWAVVVFGDSRAWYLRWLKRGFRHCFVAVETEVGWIGLDPLLHRSVLGWVPVHPETPADALVRHYLDLGLTAAAVCIVPEPTPRLRFPMPLTCVEAVKRVLGLGRPTLMTPHQLWRFLLRSPLVVYSAPD